MKLKALDMTLYQLFAKERSVLPKLYGAYYVDAFKYVSFANNTF